ncbi:MAG: DUF86 domain-containing protein [Alphaproteobacteria bacterium]|nr:DUF86 domain-containing protein [Alphaproteobacteria bacterium]
MSIKDWRVRIEDILEAIGRTRRYVEGMSRADFCADDRTIDAVVRNLEIIGEAANRVPPDIAIHHREVPWHRMAEMRHILIHEYHAVDPCMVWHTIHHDLPPLIKPLKAMLHDEAVA